MSDFLTLSAFKKFAQELRFPGIQRRMQEWNEQVKLLRCEVASMRKEMEILQAERNSLKAKQDNLDELEQTINADTLNEMIILRKQLREEFQSEIRDIRKEVSLISSSLS